MMSSLFFLAVGLRMSIAAAHKSASRARCFVMIEKVNHKQDE